ncbi:hypothetical protein WR25_23042 [Diploscapter pachys]|uniref:F-box domain-containing protein n=1 Tax=Diploscapter pachys TaxID=2018661 RepID=A0A2A2JD51_9BILA|nr:hypothetical protein WR25_23042 [Diploscapter pachys]
MILNLPPELVLITIRHLSIADVKQLAWSNRRIMQIVRRNRPQALNEFWLTSDMSNIFGQYSDKNKFLLDIMFKNGIFSNGFKTIIRNEEDKVRYADVDRKTLSIFRKYCLYLKKQEKSKKGAEPWMNYVSMHQSPDNDVMEEPFLALHLLIPRIDIQNLTIVNCSSDQLGSIIKVLDASCAKIDRSILHCRNAIFSSNGDERMFTNSVFLERSVATFEIATPPFISQILQMPQFRDKNWLLSEATNDQCVSMLSVREAKLIRILSGKLSIREFMAVINA